MQRIPTRLDGPILLAPTVHGDERGFFLETYRQSTYRDAGIADEFVQHNHSRSRRGVVRGMHFQPGMTKLVRCARGGIFDVVVDVRKESPTFGEWEAFQLDDEENRQLYVPDGFAHGFCVVSDLADLVYQCSAYYDPSAESGFKYDDPDVGIEWPDVELVPSERDVNAPLLRTIMDDLPFVYKP
ncbi:MAG: dTDP-4-dehydrorhamnose 3,5-epimerase [Actinobacteria bacterium]|nr:dTDP-4-dehydrorhamnose 3,5-epimerase [Actinomycetota bacterium]